MQLMMKKHGIQDPFTFTGMERVAARIGDGGLDVGFYLSNTDSLHARANRLFSQSLAQVNGRVLEENDVDCIMDGTPDVEELGIPFEEIPEQMSATVGTEYGEFFGAMHLVSNAGESPEVYYYHGDHLGSASWITDASGTAVQHLQYLPFGERFVDQRTSGYCERFTFTGKERDEETGYGYFGARYMDHELMTSFISVDRYADKYPFISPYAYCTWNPIKLIDPTGDTIDVSGLSKKQLAIYMNSVNLLKKSPLFAYYYEELQKSSTTYALQAGPGYGGEGSFDPNNNTISANLDNLHSLSQEMFHAFQSDGNFYTSNDASVRETEGDLVSLLVLDDIGELCPQFGNWANSFNKYRFDEYRENLAEDNFISDFDKMVDDRINYYMKTNNPPPNYIQPNSHKGPQALLKALKGASNQYQQWKSDPTKKPSVGIHIR